MSLYYFLQLDKITVIGFFWECNCPEVAEGYMEALLDASSAQEDEWLNVSHGTPSKSRRCGYVWTCSLQWINRGFIFPLQQQQLAFLRNWLWEAVCLVCESLCGSSPTFLPPPYRSVESQFISPRLQFLLFIVWKWVCIEMKRNHILICLELVRMW